MSKSDANSRVDVQAFIDSNKFSSFQWMIFIICVLVALFDGFDTAVIGYIVHDLSIEWGVEKSSALATVLSAALFGLAIGAVSFGPLADKIGRKKILLLSVAVFTMGTFASAFSSSLGELEIYRFITGIGLGAAMPNAVTLLSEYCPTKNRFLIVNTMYCGFPVGVAVTGSIAYWFIPLYGWRSVLYLGAFMPFILLIFMYFLLPESARYLVIKSKSTTKIKQYLSKISKTALSVDRFYLTEKVVDKNKEQKSGIAVILSKHYLVGTIALCISYFMGLVIFYSIINWMPFLFKESNMPSYLGTLVTSLFALGGLGAIANGWLMDRYNPSKLIMGFSLLTSVGLCLIAAFLHSNIILLVIVVIFSGIVMNTAQSSLPAFAANFFPTSGRTTGVAWMLGLGRFGAIAGTFLVSIMKSFEFSLAEIFYVLAIPSLITALALYIHYQYYKNK